MKRIETQLQLEELFRQERAILLKHSNFCPISRDAHSEMKRLCEEHPDWPCYMVLVVEDRPLSRWVESYTGIRHESPQVMVVEGGQVRWHASHYDVEFEQVSRQLKTRS